MGDCQNLVRNIYGAYGARSERGVHFPKPISLVADTGTLNRYTDLYTDSQILPDEQNANLCAFRCFENTSLVLLNVLESVEQHA